MGKDHLRRVRGTAPQPPVSRNPEPEPDPAPTISLHIGETLNVILLDGTVKEMVLVEATGRVNDLTLNLQDKEQYIRRNRVQAPPLPSPTSALPEATASRGGICDGSDREDPPLCNCGLPNCDSRGSV